jgi:hypothetical protein
MARLLLPNDFVELTIVCIADEQASENIVHYHIGPTPPPTATDLDFAAAFDGSIASTVKSMMGSVTSYRGCGARILFGTPTNRMQVSVANAGPGTSGTGALPRQTAGLIATQTDFVGRSQRGRFYAAFPAGAFDTGDGLPSAGYVTILNTLGALLYQVTSIAVSGRTANFVPVILHRKTKTGDQILSYISRTVWATQKRRGSYGRANPSPF